MRLVIDAKRLLPMLGKENLLLVDTRPNGEYSKSHIPGAVNVDLMQFHWIDTSKEGIRQFNRQMRILLSNIGVSSDKFVVFYDAVSGSSAARGVWLLLYFSHTKVAMLDGGMSAWKANGFKTETMSNPFLHSAFTGRTNTKLLADYKLVNSAIRSGGAIIIDARSKAEYGGSAPRAARVGHIPGAVNIDWAGNLANYSFKPDAKLKKKYEKIPREKEIITYCQGGYRAANTFVVLKDLGYKNVRMYLGSWGEWGNRPDLPVANK